MEPTSDSSKSTDEYSTDDEVNVGETEIGEQQMEVIETTSPPTSGAGLAPDHMATNNKVVQQQPMKP